ncbi:F-box/WD repeat-containing protein 7-like, partial [Tachysurus ichikawai]
MSCQSEQPLMTQGCNPDFGLYPDDTFGSLASGMSVIAVAVKETHRQFDGTRLCHTSFLSSLNTSRLHDTRPKRLSARTRAGLTSSGSTRISSWSGPEKLLALDELIDSCEPTQVKHMMQVIEPQFQRDFISLLPKE